MLQNRNADDSDRDADRDTTLTTSRSALVDAVREGVREGLEEYERDEGTENGSGSDADSGTETDTDSSSSRRITPKRLLVGIVGLVLLTSVRKRRKGNSDEFSDSASAGGTETDET